MHEQIQPLLAFARGIPVGLVYLLLAAGAGLENVFPPVPSDTFVIAAGILVQQGVLGFWPVYAVVCTANVALALAVYGLARSRGRAIFRTRWGHWLLRPHQLEQLADFYSRYGTATIFVSRFLPVFRVLVPVFGGITGLGFWRTALPLTLASLAWYAAVLEAGVLVARHAGDVLRLVARVNLGALVTAAALLCLLGAWWWRSRHRGGREPDA